VIQDAADKFAAWTRLIEVLRLTPDQCAHIGDDLPDLPVMAACGLAATVPHAPAGVRERAHFVTARDGGAGAVREVAELILTAQGKLEEAEAGRQTRGRRAQV
jgi:3-deoxy-D-manno-octulosonate 8-phosphate phosphatase (KDO 8-P phosphatase)